MVGKGGVVAPCGRLVYGRCGSDMAVALGEHSEGLRHAGVDIALVAAEKEVVDHVCLL